MFTHAWRIRLIDSDSDSELPWIVRLRANAAESQIRPRVNPLIYRQNNMSPAEPVDKVINIFKT